MGPLRVAPLGFQQVATSTSTAFNLTLPYGAQQAQGTSCNLSGRLLTVGGTVTGTFAAGQVVVGTGIPANTTIASDPIGSTNTYNLSNSCSTQTGVTVTGYTALPMPDFAVIRAVTNPVVWRDDGTGPQTSGVGITIATTDPPFEYYGNLAAIQFIGATGAGTLNIAYYRIVG